MLNLDQYNSLGAALRWSRVALRSPGDIQRPGREVGWEKRPGNHAVAEKGDNPIVNIRQHQGTVAERQGVVARLETDNDGLRRMER